jgi:acyl carrier protein
MNHETTRTIVEEIIREGNLLSLRAEDDVDFGRSLKKDYKINSLNYVKLLVGIEERFAVSFSEQVTGELFECDCLRDVVDLIDRYLKDGR